jgi:uroporphyrin-III C-methyltransferase
MAGMSLLSRLQPPSFEPGSVWLVGAGPGDPGLLTLHAAHALATADVVLHDALVPSEIVALAETPWREAVGKRAGGARVRQMRVNERLIALARGGKRVLRLKGGDPLIFGRGGEEALALAAAGVRFRIIPGVSAGVGGTGTAGIPLTHRSVARSVLFATGHDSHGAVPESLNFDALARAADVLVFYMALRRAGEIAERLIAAGRSAIEQVAFIAEASTARQRVTTATLATAGAVAAGLPQTSPTLIVIGPVVALCEVLGAGDATPMRLASDLNCATA